MSEIHHDQDLVDLLNETRKPFQFDLELRPGESPVAAVPDGYTLEDVERFFEWPSRHTGTVSLHDVGSFIRYVSEHGANPDTEEAWSEAVRFAPHSATHLYVRAEKGMNGQYRTSVIAVLNDHGRGQDSVPGWRDYRAVFNPAASLEWETWTKNDRKEMTQAAFATFLEDNLPDIRAHDPTHPTSGDMLQMATQFEALRNKVFTSSVDLQSGGVAFNFVDKDNEATKSRMQAFERFGIAIPVFQSGVNETPTLYGIAARLKYKQEGASLKLWYELIRPDRIFRDATADIIKQITEAGFQVLNGDPDATA